MNDPTSSMLFTATGAVTTTLPYPKTPPDTYGMLVPCKNGAAFLPRLFAATRDQTRPFDEVWLFDDGSSDGSGEVAASFGARVLRSDRSLGPSAARNRLIEACSCTWLHFHDADDTLDGKYLERVAAEARTDIDVVICDMVWLDETTGAVENHWHYDAAALASDAASYLIVNTVGGINGLYRRTALLAAGAFDEKLGYWEDLDLSLRLSRHGARITVVNEDLVMAYRRRASYSNSNLGEVWRVKLQLIRSLLPGAGESLRRTIAAEAEQIANRFAALGNWRDVPMALVLNHEAGGSAPTTGSLVFRLLKRVLPGTSALWLQRSLRMLLRSK